MTNHVSVLDFDLTLTKEHTYRKSRLDVMQQEGQTAEERIEIGRQAADNNLKDNLKNTSNPLLSLEGDNVFAIATYHNNPDYIAGYYEAISGKTVTPIPDSVKYSEDGKVALRQYQVQGIDKPFTVSYIPALGQDYQNIIANLDGKNEQMNLIQQTFESSALMNHDDPMHLYDDSRPNIEAANTRVNTVAHQIDDHDPAFYQPEVIEQEVTPDEPKTDIPITEPVQATVVSEEIKTEPPVEQPIEKASVTEEVKTEPPVEQPVEKASEEASVTEDIKPSATDNIRAAGLVYPKTLSSADASRLAIKTGQAVLRESTTVDNAIAISLPNGKKYLMDDVIALDPDKYQSPEQAIQQITTLFKCDIAPNPTHTILATGLVHPKTLSSEDANTLAKETGQAVLRMSTTENGSIAISLPTGTKHLVDDVSNRYPEQFSSPEKALQQIESIYGFKVIEPWAKPTLDERRAEQQEMKTTCETIRTQHPDYQTGFVEEKIPEPSGPTGP